MNNHYSNNYPIINLYRKASTRSEVVTQMIYGDEFKIINKYPKWLRVKVKEDKYIGFIKKKKFFSYTKPTHKVSVLFAKVYKSPSFKNKITTV